MQTYDAITDLAAPKLSSLNLTHQRTCASLNNISYVYNKYFVKEILNVLKMSLFKQ